MCIRDSFNTDSTMFHVNEAKEGKAELTVKNGKMTAHKMCIRDSLCGGSDQNHKKLRCRNESGWT